MSLPIHTYRFSRSIEARVQECTANDNWHGPWELCRHWLMIGAGVAVSLWAWDALPMAAAIAVYAGAVWFIGGRQRGLADVLHKAAHRTLTSDRRLGRVLGTYFAGYPVLQSYSGYVASHVRDHHGQLGDPLVDPDYLQYQRNGICGEKMRSESVRRYLVSIFLPGKMLSYLRYLVVDRIANREEDRRERVRRLAYLFALATFFVATGNGLPLVAYWFLPLVTTQVWIGSLIELVEHYPLIETAPRVDLYVSRNRHCSRISNFLLGITPHEGYHLIHHKFAAVPPWRHHEVHKILMADEEYAALNRTRGWMPILRELVTLQTRVHERAAGASTGDA